MIELAVAEGIALLGKIGYDVWKRWLENRSPGAAVVSDGSPSYVRDPTAIPSMLPYRGPVMSTSVLIVGLHPQDELALHYIFQEHPCLLVITDYDHPDVDGFVVSGRVADIHEILLPPGRYGVSAFVFADEGLTTVSGVGWEEELTIHPGFDADLSLAIGVVADEISEAVVDFDYGEIRFDTGDVVSLLGTVIYIGRGELNDIVIDDLGVSNQHVVIGLTPNGWAIEDLGSLNGTYVNGRPIHTAYLQEGDIVTIGSTRFVLS